jgi:Sap, sulfolipid-1-addressing protein
VSKVFLFSLTAAANPTLLTATTVMLLLPRPKRLLLGYLLGALTTGITVGIVLVNWLSDSSVVSTTKHTISPSIDITIGCLLLLVAIVVGTGKVGKRTKEPAESPKKTPRWQRAMSNGSARTTFVIGILLSFPGASYLAALTEISKQNLNQVEIVLTVIASNLIMLILLELPLIGYALAPEWTPAAVDRLKTWIAGNARRIIVIGATVVGVALILRGVLTLG